MTKLYYTSVGVNNIKHVLFLFACIIFRSYFLLAEEVPLSKSRDTPSFETLLDNLEQAYMNEAAIKRAMLEADQTLRFSFELFEAAQIFNHEITAPSTLSALKD